jgi:DNA-binding FadR family transcriptional regulator
MTRDDGLVTSHEGRSQRVESADSALLHGRLAEELGADIVAGRWPPHQAVAMETLETRYGMSRTVVREVVRSLAARGLVRSRRRVGVVVCPPGDWQVFDPDVIRWRLAGPGRGEQLRSLVELRAGFEPQAAALAAARADDDDCRELATAVTGMRRTGARGDLEAYLAHDIRFHTVLLRAAGNEMLLALAPVVAEVLTGRTHHHLMPRYPEPEAIRLHGEVADAVAEGDAGRARAAMVAILGEAHDALSAMLAEEPADRRRES